MAAVYGLPNRLIHYFLMTLLTMVTVASLQTVGIILVVAMLITPAATAYLLDGPAVGDDLFVRFPRRFVSGHRPWIKLYVQPLLRSGNRARGYDFVRTFLYVFTETRRALESCEIKRKRAALQQ